jgi:hypothetical protein
LVLSGGSRFPMLAGVSCFGLTLDRQRLKGYFYTNLGATLWSRISGTTAAF